MTFLSCLGGSERYLALAGTAADFLSCLGGSERRFRNLWG